MAQQENQVATVNKQEVAAAIGNTTIADSILKSFNTLATQGQLIFPKGYAVGNQLKLMYTSLSQNGAITKVTPISIGESLTEAVVQGLEIDKKQVYFIPRGNKLTMFRSYFGDVAVAKRTGLVVDMRARVIYEGDTYEVDTDEYGEEIITNHKTRLENHDNPIVGGYAWAVLPDGSRIYCIMTKKEIDTAWSKSSDPTRNTQKDFPQEMTKRSVIRRLAKRIFNTSSTELTDEQKAIIASFNRTTEQEYDNTLKETNGVKKVVVDDDGTIIDDDFGLEQPAEVEKPSEEPKE